ncbi:unnamed protein product [Prunus armeniaca]
MKRHGLAQGTWKWQPFLFGNGNSLIRCYLEPIGQRQIMPCSDTLARVLYNMKFYEDSEVEEVKQKGLQMSRFMPFSVCIIGGVPQQRDGCNFPTYWPHSTSCRIMTVQFIEHLSAGLSVHKIDPSKIKYYRLKLAIEGCTRGSFDGPTLARNPAFLLELVGFELVSCC